MAKRISEQLTGNSPGMTEVLAGYGHIHSDMNRFPHSGCDDVTPVVFDLKTLAIFDLSLPFNSNYIVSDEIEDVADRDLFDCLLNDRKLIKIALVPIAKC